jgi:uncharacterized zinc-type alcohol dehydrogenase-like protein
MLDSVAAEYDFGLYLALLKTDGPHIVAGLPAAFTIPALDIRYGRKGVVGSMISELRKPRKCWIFVRRIILYRKLTF